jgi:SAM-dependent MidA family methyltransferase
MNEIVQDRLAAWLQEKGRLTFAEFMETALYHPEAGYYNRPEMTIGEQGDFYTSPMVHPIFGACVARQIHQMWRLLGRPAPFCLLEMGAGVGSLAVDILTASQQDPDYFAALRYTIVEQSAGLCERQRQHAEENGMAGKIVWQPTLRDVAADVPRIDLIVTNELFDALPVHRLARTEAGYGEFYIERDGDGYREVLGELSDPSLLDLLDDETKRQLDPGDRFEVCPAAAEVIREMGGLVEKGVVLTIDYGDLAPDVHLQHVNGNGVRAFYKQTAAQPLERVGEQDLTADVDFSLLVREGEKAGLELVGFTTQLHLLGGNGILRRIEELQARWFDAQADLELQKLLGLFLPHGLGDLFKVLIQAKGVNADEVRGEIDTLKFRP